MNLPLPTPPGTPQAVRDARAVVAAVSRRSRRDPSFEGQFLLARRRLLVGLPLAKLAVPRRRLDELDRRLRELGHGETPPVPGGVGCGIFYNQPFKDEFTSGTALYWEIVSPPAPGGNVSTYLYLTAMNRAAKGVEALLVYYGQSDSYFIVYDWSREDGQRWQHNIPAAELAPYRRTDASHGTPFPTLTVLNVTLQNDGTTWTNQAYLLNQALNCWDFIYEHVYPAGTPDQHNDDLGSWAPIVETFQPQFSGTLPLGALNTMLAGRSGASWDPWTRLDGNESAPRNDNQGFQLTFLDPNYNWVVQS
jgi:hypothetical protein